ncbi:uncharacterized protein BO88DRAFT_429939 [Aspergillus vadensis CBS 113365]|uniref:Uncharacterized protein n=1 Tax=Aspergillus vadensis (strain CBS 113365 / IMI 142717 / IBT 24658) TaxID=1448311 RepID=A0A319BDV4_ASPVC|nr:hypothetical protein BO88DRAFT_429939 [Aspergillus vadensis CBS 113365]PYH64103.1 hypothetical protein BO88DRAFT_429939 [Aspergillus vadensis CBS 113365]
MVAAAVLDVVATEKDAAVLGTGARHDGAVAGDVAAKWGAVVAAAAAVAVELVPVFALVAVDIGADMHDGTEAAGVEAGMATVEPAAAGTLTVVAGMFAGLAVAGPDYERVVGSAVLLAAEPAVAPVAELAVELVAAPVAEPAAGPFAGPAAEPVAAPAAEPVVAPVVELAAGLAELSAGPVAGLVVEPAVLSAELVAVPAAELAGPAAADTSDGHVAGKEIAEPVPDREKPDAGAAGIGPADTGPAALDTAMLELAGKEIAAAYAGTATLVVSVDTRTEERHAEAGRWSASATPQQRFASWDACAAPVDAEDVAAAVGQKTAGEKQDPSHAHAGTWQPAHSSWDEYGNWPWGSYSVAGSARIDRDPSAGQRSRHCETADRTSPVAGNVRRTDYNGRPWGGRLQGPWRMGSFCGDLGTEPPIPPAIDPGIGRHYWPYREHDGDEQQPRQSWTGTADDAAVGAADEHSAGAGVVDETSAHYSPSF